MMNNKIIERENESASIEKLTAQREIYSIAKFLFILQTLFSVVILVLLSFSQLLFQCIDFTLIIATISLLAVIIDYGLEIKINRLKELAAKVQEHFDTYVLQLNWNSILCLDKPEYDLIHNYYQQHKEKNDISQFVNWYEPEIQKVEENVARLICQKTNCNYDKSIRKRYNTVVMWTGIITISLIILFTIFSGLTLAKILLTIIFPSIPILQWTLRNIHSNNQSILTLEQLNSLINSNWEQAKNGLNIDNSTLRQIQDGIFLNRKSSPLIPDYVYNKMRSKLEKQTRYTVKQLVNEILSKK